VKLHLQASEINRGQPELPFMYIAIHIKVAGISSVQAEGLGAQHRP